MHFMPSIVKQKQKNIQERSFEEFIPDDTTCYYIYIHLSNAKISSI